MDVTYQSVSVDIAGSRIVSSIDMQVAAGGFVGIVGPNGSGKSTTLRCLYRALTPTTGDVAVSGVSVRAISMRENARQVAALTQDMSLDFDFTAAEVVATGRLPHGTSLRSTSEQDRRICAEATETADVTALADRTFSSLSGGERQRVLIARALAQQPRVLVLDEPTNHLDVRHQYSILSSAQILGITVIAALHDLNLAAQYCDTIHVMAEGRIVLSGPPHEVITAESIGRWFGIGCHVIAHPRSGVPQIIFDPQPERQEKE
ncbi:ABC transporter ATP-binding protein [Mycobacteroides salmoniphilum]|uniref:ABC transporter ATP-binding protein n=1 Tax=Mycobacteroides salmoniphilum TaxID=404941 RepID=UPI000991C37A|nr:ABC transporter ATP-binding protein [Mycobacteroides salmoniphilum]QCH22222.1 Hemin import ATP-binding protein HmuV [Mycobacteroides salmoniphilum]